MRLRVLLLSFIALTPVGAGAGEIARGTIVDGIAAASDPTQTYAVYLPTSYDPARSHPLLAVFDPRSRGAMAAEIFREAAEARGWIVISSNDTRSDGPWEPNVRAVNAILPDAVRRFAVDSDRVYAAGFSGGAMLAWVVGQTSGRLAGVISVGGRLPEGIPLDEIRFAHYGAAGNRDFNYAEMHAIEGFLAKRRASHRLTIFEGRHQWFPAELAREAIDWFEVLAMRDGRRERDAKSIEAVLAREVAAAEAAEAAGLRLEAARRFAMLAATFEGLAETGAFARRADALFASREVRREARDEERRIDWEKGELRALQRVLAANRDPERPTSVRRLAHELRIPLLLRRAESRDPEGDAAGRVLGSLYAQLSFYLPRDPATGDARAALYLEVAREIEETGWLDYQLAALYGRMGRNDDALDLLGEAVRLGIPPRASASIRDDFPALRDDPRFAELVAALARAE